MARTTLEHVEGPAVIHGGHEQTRHLRVVAGSKMGWVNRREHPLTWAFDRGQLGRGGAIEMAEAKRRLNAGEEYRVLYETSRGRTRDSTDLDVVKGGGGYPITIAMADAVKKLVAIDFRLGKNDRTLIRRVCGEGYTLAQAIADVFPSDKYRHGVSVRFCEALDALIAAMAEAQKAGWKM